MFLCSEINVSAVYVRCYDVHVRVFVFRMWGYERWYAIRCACVCWCVSNVWILTLVCHTFVVMMCMCVSLCLECDYRNRCTAYVRGYDVHVRMYMILSLAMHDMPLPCDKYVITCRHTMHSSNVLVVTKFFENRLPQNHLSRLFDSISNWETRMHARMRHVMDEFMTDTQQQQQQ